VNKRLTIEPSGEKAQNSQKKTAETNLSDNEMPGLEKWSLIAIESAPYGVMVHDENGKIMIFNSELERISGYRRREIPDVATWIEKVYPDEEYRKLVLEQRKEKLPKERRRVRDAIVTRKDGEKRICEFSSVLSFEGIRTVFIKDTSTLRRIEDSLRESESRFRELAENLHEVFWLFDWKNQKMEYVSPAYESVWGRRPQDLYNNYDNWTDSIYPDDAAYAAESFARIVETGGGKTREYRIVRPDGTVRWVSDRGFAIRDKNGKVARIAGIAEDITERRQAIEALAESEEKFRTVTEQSPNMIFINSRGRVVYANRQCEQLMGYSRDEFYEPDFEFMNLIAPESRELIQQSFKNHMQGEEIEPYEYALVDKWGGRIDVIITTKLINYEGQRSILGIITDISERKQAEKALEAKDRDLERQSRSLEEVNTALKVLLEQREKEKAELKEELLVNIKKLIFPYIEKLETRRLDEDAKTYINVINSNLKNLISPLTNTQSSRYFEFTPSEIQIADLIKEGKTSKDIAAMLNISPKAVSFHRGNIRKKLGLSNKKINLRSYLQSFPK
jgi:PAS domain S-box-containing protein